MSPCPLKTFCLWQACFWACRPWWQMPLQLFVQLWSACFSVVFHSSRLTCVFHSSFTHREISFSFSESACTWREREKEALTYVLSYPVCIYPHAQVHIWHRQDASPLLQGKVLHMLADSTPERSCCRGHTLSALDLHNGNIYFKTCIFKIPFLCNKLSFLNSSYFLFF